MASLLSTIPGASLTPVAVLARGTDAIPANLGKAQDSLPIGAARTVAKNEEIYGEGDPATWYFKILKGVVRTCKILDDGRRQIDAFHVAGDIIGLERGETYRFSAEAICDATVVAYRRCTLDTLAACEVPLARQVVATALASLERAQEHMVLLGRKSAVEKIASFLLDMANRVAAEAIELPMSRSDIADYLGLTIETVSRTLTQLERDGVIALPGARRNIVLRSKAALRRLSA